MKLDTVYAALWITWVTAFLGIEFSAIFTGHSQFSLSAFVWRLEEINRGWTFLRYAVAVTCLWLFFHLAFGLFR